MATHRSRVLIAEDHQLVAEAVKHLLDPEFDVIGIVNDGRELVNAAITHRPDVVIVDVSLPLLSGLDAWERIKQQTPATELILLTVNADPYIAADAFRHGASAIVTKQSTVQDLLVAIRCALRHQSYLSPVIAKHTVEFLLRSGDTSSDKRQLTERQAEVLQLLAEGKAMKEVADILKIAQATVAFHKYKLMNKLGVSSNAGLIQYAMRHRLC